MIPYKSINGLSTHTSESPSSSATGDIKAVNHFTPTGVSTLGLVETINMMIAMQLRKAYFS